MTTPMTLGRGSEAETPRPIPNRFIFVYGLGNDAEPFHLIHYLCLRSCLEVNEPRQLTLCTPEEPHGPYWDQIKSEVDLVPVEKVPLVTDFRYQDRAIEPYRYAHHSDFIRMDQLLKHGGIYADLDTLFVNPLPERLFREDFVLGREADIADPRTGQATASLCNAVILSRPDAAFGRRWRAAMEEAFDGTWSNHSTLLPRRLAQQYSAEIHIEPEQSFYLFPPTGEGLSRLFDSKTAIPSDAYSLHLWAHLWWSAQRVDFSALDAASVTEDFLRDHDSTFGLAARPYLPRSRAMVGLQSGENPTLSAGEMSPSSAPRQGQILESDPYKQRLKMFEEFCRELSVREGFEKTIVASVIRDDGYGLGTRTFGAADVVLDVGAHIGAFSFLCHHLGCRNIVAFEPDPRNYERLESSLGRLAGFHPDPRAVFRSDVTTPDGLRHSGPLGVNTGGGNVILGGAVFSPINQQAWTLSDQVSAAETVSLDQVLSRFERIALLKLDCEGSEFPILLTSRELARVDEIVGEYHEISSRLMGRIDPAARVGTLSSYSGPLLGARLQAAGFEVRLLRQLPHMGIFRAVRPRARS